MSGVSLQHLSVIWLNILSQNKVVREQAVMFYAVLGYTSKTEKRNEGLQKLGM